MDDLRAELATLVADLAETFDGLRGQGVRFVPRESQPFVPEPLPPPLAPTPRAAAPPPRAEAPPRPAASPPLAAFAPRPTPPAPPVSLAPPAPRTPPPAAVPSPAAAPPPEGAGLLGRWAGVLASPAERLRKAQEKLPSACPGCGQPPLLGSGGTSSGLALLYDAGSAAEEETLANMLVRVVGVEPADVLTFHPRACVACAEAIATQIEAIRPRVVLALGPHARASLGSEAAVWSRFAGVDAVGSFHPAELAADPSLKRPAFETLKQVASRR